MAIIYNEYGNHSNYVDKRDTFILQEEGNSTKPYCDTRGLVTIGYGFNIEEFDDYFDLVLGRMDIDIDDSEDSYYSRLKKEIEKPVTNNTDLQSRLNVIMKERTRLTGVASESLKTQNSAYQESWQKILPRWCAALPAQLRNPVLICVIYEHQCRDGSRTAPEWWQTGGFAIIRACLCVRPIIIVNICYLGRIITFFEILL